MKLKTIIRRKFLPPTNNENVYTFSAILGYGIGIKGIFKSFYYPFAKIANLACYATTDEEDHGFGTELDIAESGGEYEKKYFSSIEDAREHCWDHFERFYTTKPKA